MRRMISTARTWDDGEKRCTWGVFGNSFKAFFIVSCRSNILGGSWHCLLATYSIVDDRLSNATIDINGKIQGI